MRHGVFDDFAGVELHWRQPRQVGNVDHDGGRIPVVPAGDEFGVAGLALQHDPDHTLRPQPRARDIDRDGERFQGLGATAVEGDLSGGGRLC